MTTSATGLGGLRVLLVEDSLLVAETIAELLEAAAVSVVGPIGQVHSALAAAQRERLDGALLDVNLAGQSSLPVAEALHARGIPFIFLTGYSDRSALPEAFRDMPRLVKPFPPSELIAAMEHRFRLAGGAKPMLPDSH